MYVVLHKSKKSAKNVDLLVEMSWSITSIWTWLKLSSFYIWYKKPFWCLFMCNLTPVLDIRKSIPPYLAYTLIDFSEILESTKMVLVYTDQMS